MRIWGAVCDRPISVSLRREKSTNTVKKMALKVLCRRASKGIRQWPGLWQVHRQDCFSIGEYTQTRMHTKASARAHMQENATLSQTTLSFMWVFCCSLMLLYPFVVFRPSATHLNPSVCTVTKNACDCSSLNSTMPARRARWRSTLNKRGNASPSISEWWKLEVKAGCMTWRLMKAHMCKYY